MPSVPSVSFAEQGKAMRLKSSYPDRGSGASGGIGTIGSVVVQDSGNAVHAISRSSHSKGHSVANPSKGKQPMPSTS